MFTSITFTTTAGAEAVGLAPDHSGSVLGQEVLTALPD